MQDRSQIYQMEDVKQPKIQLKSQKVLHTLKLSIADSKQKALIVNIKIKYQDDPDSSATDICNIQFVRIEEQYYTNQTFNFTFFFQKAYELIATVMTKSEDIIAWTRDNYRYIARKKTQDLQLTSESKDIVGTLTISSQSIDQNSLTAKLIVDYGQVNLGGCFCFPSTKCYIKIQRESDKTEIYSYYNESSKKRLQIILQNLQKLQNERYILSLYQNQTSKNLIGQCFFQLKDFKNRSSFNRELRKDKKLVGRVNFSDIQVKELINPQERYMNFHQAGVKVLHMSFIDFTDSNYSSKLHGSEILESKYQKALMSVGKVVLQKDSIGNPLLYGFGAKVSFPELSSGDSQLSYFALNGNKNNPQVQGLQGLLETYQKSKKFIVGGSQTLFAPILKIIKQKAIQQKLMKRSYIIATIYTDGIIDDPQETMDLLVEMGRLPVSIIIVGIGEGEKTSKGDWLTMRELDDNQMKMVDSKGRKTERDLVKFVAYKELEGKEKFAEEVLSEYTQQFLEYHRLENIKPTDYEAQILHSRVQTVKPLLTREATMDSSCYNYRTRANRGSY